MAKLEHKQGATFHVDAQWKVNGEAIDITGDTFTCTMKNAKNSYSISVGILYEASGEFELDATAAQTLLWAIGNYDVDIRRETPSGEVFPTQTFVIEVEARVT